MLTFPYKSKVISLFVWSKTCSRISNLYRYVISIEIAFSVTLSHLRTRRNTTPHRKCAECSGVGVTVKVPPVCLPSCPLLYAWLLRFQDPSLWMKNHLSYIRYYTTCFYSVALLMSYLLAVLSIINQKCHHFMFKIKLK